MKEKKLNPQATPTAITRNDGSSGRYAAWMREKTVEEMYEYFQRTSLRRSGLTYAFWRRLIVTKVS